MGKILKALPDLLTACAILICGVYGVVGVTAAAWRADNGLVVLLCCFAFASWLHVWFTEGR